MRRLSGAALIVLGAIIPLYGTLAVLDPSRPPIPPLLPAPVAIAIGVLAMAAVIATIPAAVRSARWDALTLALLGPGLVCLVSSLTGFDPPTGVAFSLLLLGLGGSGLALARDADAATVRAIIRCFLWSALASCVLALVMVVAHRPAALYAYDNGRAVGTFLNPNELAAFTLAGLGIALPLAVVSRGRDRLAVATAIVLVAALGATFSRWGALCAVCGVAAYGLADRKRWLFVAALAVALVGVGLDTWIGAQHHNPRDAESRVVAWRTGITTFLRFPLLGVGPLAFEKTYDELRPPDAPGPQTPVAFDPHSLPITFAAECGIFAEVALAATFTILLRVAFGAARGAPPLQRALALSLAAAFIALILDSGINSIVVFFALTLQVAPLAYAVVRTDAI
jgi:O-Antigen ligase